jgi:hypothetical protein
MTAHHFAKTYYLPLLFEPLKFLTGLRVLFGGRGGAPGSGWSGAPGHSLRPLHGPGMLRTAPLPAGRTAAVQPPPQPAPLPARPASPPPPPAGDQVLCCRARDLAAVGGYRRELPIMEDADLALRLHAAGPAGGGGVRRCWPGSCWLPLRLAGLQV